MVERRKGKAEKEKENCERGERGSIDMMWS
jgi:hypothetical protein